jgi:hypothetical protein
MERDDDSDPYGEEIEYMFEFVQAVGDADTITLVCHSSRKLSMDEYVEALYDFLKKFEVEEILRDAQREPGSLLH